MHTPQHLPGEKKTDIDPFDFNAQYAEKKRLSTRVITMERDPSLFEGDRCAFFTCPSGCESFANLPKDYPEPEVARAVDAYIAYARANRGPLEPLEDAPPTISSARLPDRLPTEDPTESTNNGIAIGSGQNSDSTQSAEDTEQVAV